MNMTSLAPRLTSSSSTSTRLGTRHAYTTKKQEGECRDASVYLHLPHIDARNSAERRLSKHKHMHILGTATLAAGQQPHCPAESAI